MSLNQEASPGTPGAGYQDTNERDVAAKQRGSVADSEASRDESIDLDAVKVLPGTGGPDDVGDEEVPADYDRNGRAGPGRSDPDEESAGSVDPKTLTSDGSPVENPSG
jgi:hypothetical protein